MMRSKTKQVKRGEKGALGEPGCRGQHCTGGTCTICMAVPTALWATWKAQRTSPVAPCDGEEQDDAPETVDTLLADIQAHDGAEIHRDDWPLAEQLRVRGLITLGGARGPGRNWRHATLTPEPPPMPDDILAQAAKALVMRAATIEALSRLMGVGTAMQQLALVRLKYWREAAQVLLGKEASLVLRERSPEPCCEGARRVEVVPGDATTLAGWTCPEHGVR